MASIAAAGCRKHTPQSEPVPNNDNITISGISYPTARVGKQRWTTTNYSGPGGLALEPNKNRPGYGKLYSQEEAMSIQLPPGWRLPLARDYRTLCEEVGILLPEKGNSEQTEVIEKLMSSDTSWTHGSGTNASGFAAMPSGYIYVDLAVGQGSSAKLMTSEKNGLVRTYFHVTRYANATTAGLRSVSTPESTALRFVRDEH